MAENERSVKYADTSVKLATDQAWVELREEAQQIVRRENNDQDIAEWIERFKQRVLTLVEEKRR